jgi:hypothetical protein
MWKAFWNKGRMFLQLGPCIFKLWWIKYKRNAFSKQSIYLEYQSCSYIHSGFRGLVVSMLASGTQHRGFEPGRGFFRGEKIPQHAFLRRGSKAVCSMSQICGMLKNPAIYVEVGIAGQINRPLLAQFLPSLTEVSHLAWRGAPLGMTGGTKGGAQRARNLKT